MKITATAAHAALFLSLGTAAVWAEELDDANKAYERGDYATSLKIYHSLAAKGDARAQANLGVMYDKGQGVPQDDFVAAQWYRRAARQGIARAQFNLGTLLAKGSNGVPPDYVRSHMWFDVAAKTYPESATESRERAVSSRNSVAAKMTPAQIAEAERLARKWNPNK